MRDRRVQFLPVQWRTALKLDVDEEIRRRHAGLDNEFTLDGAPLYPPELELSDTAERYNHQEVCTIRARPNE